MNERKVGNLRLSAREHLPITITFHLYDEKLCSSTSRSGGGSGVSHLPNINTDTPLCFFYGSFMTKLIVFIISLFHV